MGLSFVDLKHQLTSLAIWEVLSATALDKSSLDSVCGNLKLKVDKFRGALSSVVPRDARPVVALITP